MEILKVVNVATMEILKLVNVATMEILMNLVLLLQKAKRCISLWIFNQLGKISRNLITKH